MSTILTWDFVKHLLADWTQRLQLCLLPFFNCRHLDYCQIGNKCDLSCVLNGIPGDSSSIIQPHRPIKTHNIPPLLLYEQLFHKSIFSSLLLCQPFTLLPSASLHPLSHSIYVVEQHYVGGGPKETISCTHTHREAHTLCSNPTFCEPCGSYCCIICCNCVLFERELVYITYFITVHARVCVCVCVYLFKVVHVYFQQTEKDIKNKTDTKDREAAPLEDLTSLWSAQIGSST